MANPEQTVSVGINKEDFDNIPDAKYTKWVEAYQDKIRSRIVRYKEKGEEITDYQFQIKKRWWWIFGKLEWRFLMQTNDYVMGVNFSKHIMKIDKHPRKLEEIKQNLIKQFKNESIKN